MGRKELFRDRFTLDLGKYIISYICVWKRDIVSKTNFRVIDRTTGLSVGLNKGFISAREYGLGRKGRVLAWHLHRSGARHVVVDVASDIDALERIMKAIDYVYYNRDAGVSRVFKDVERILRKRSLRF